MSEEPKKTPWDTIGNQFIAQYYQCFDNKETRPQVAAFYHGNHENEVIIEGAYEDMILDLHHGQPLSDLNIPQESRTLKVMASGLEVAVLTSPLQPSDSLLTFEGTQHKGREEIVKKFASVPLDNILRQPTTIDCQPTSDGGVLVHVLGQLRNTSENDKVMGFSQTFHLKVVDNSYFLLNDIFRLVLHNFLA